LIAALMRLLFAVAIKLAFVAIVQYCEVAQADAPTKPRSVKVGDGIERRDKLEDCHRQAERDWLYRLPAHRKRILPSHCERLSATPLFSWGEPADRQPGTGWTLTLQRLDGREVWSRRDLAGPRYSTGQTLTKGTYEWRVTYTNTRQVAVHSGWRQFTLDPSSVASPTVATVHSPVVPQGESVAQRVANKARPRILPDGSSFEAILAAAQVPEHLPVLAAMRERARLALTQPISEPLGEGESDDRSLAGVQAWRNVRHTAAREREHMEALALIGRLDGNAGMIARAKERLTALAKWSPIGITRAAANDYADREIYLALAVGLDILYNDLSANERTAIVASLRARVLQAVQALSVIDREPYDSHAAKNILWVNQALLLSAGHPEFPEAASLLARTWDLSRYSISVWSGNDGSFGNGIAYAWWSFVVAIPYAAATRCIAGVDLYQLAHMARAGEQLIAFTAPNHRQPSAFGDETETEDLYANYVSNYFRLHAQLTRNPVDAWYWQVNRDHLSRPGRPLIWQLLLLGADASPLPSPQPPRWNHWFSADAGLAAIHVDAAQSARTSLFLRSSRFGAFSHSHADQNSLVYVSHGRPLLINAGYYPYYNSPHHKSVTRATRYKNALTFDGGYGQSESVLGAARPSAPFQSMEARGELLLSEVRGSLTVLTGDATEAYRAIDPAKGTWVPLLSNAVRSVVMDRTNRVILVYDWATSAIPRRWELNYHSPNAFSANASTVKASNGTASVCLDRYGPTSSFAQTMAWDVPPEVSQPAQAHGRFTMLNPSTELAHLTVLRDGCRPLPVEVQLQGTRIEVNLGAQTVVFDKREVTQRH
jgi:hypothetical protein